MGTPGPYPAVASLIAPATAAAGVSRLSPPHLLLPSPTTGGKVAHLIALREPSGWCKDRVKLRNAVCPHGTWESWGGGGFDLADPAPGYLGSLQTLKTSKQTKHTLPKAAECCFNPALQCL